VNIFTSVGTLMSATLIGVAAEFAGGDARGLAVAYGGVAVVMALMLLATLALRSAPRGEPVLHQGA